VARCGLLIDASGQPVYNWQEGKAGRVPSTCRPSSRSETWVAGRQTRSSKRVRPH